MATTGTLTNKQICTRALRKIGVIAQGETPEAVQMDEALDSLNTLLKAWQNRGVNLHTYSQVSVALTMSNAHTVTPRPFGVHSIRFKRGAIETPMTRLTRDEYFDLPVKTSTGQPTTFYVDRQRETTTVYVWPVLASANGETLEMTVTREFEDVGINDVVDVPAEYYEAVIYGLAARLADEYDEDLPTVVARAEEELRIAEAHDAEGSVYFVDYEG